MLKFWLGYVLCSIVMYAAPQWLFDPSRLDLGDTIFYTAVLMGWVIGWVCATVPFIVRDVWPVCCGRVKVLVE